ncbi:hypothetical protein AAG570_013593 [Ranatra chinensis]|uniref:Uncharacterized protein n=1 Tax=Ranatra chinensis TaxID=642074 RepID=A0ABD0YCM6_9HEMI
MTGTPGGRESGSNAGIWGTVSPAEGVSVTGQLGLGSNTFPGGVTSSTTNIGLSGTAGGSSLSFSGSKTGTSTGINSQTISGTFSQTVPISDNFGLRGTIGQAHTTGTQGKFDTTSLGVAGLGNVAGGTASLGFSQTQTSGTGGFSQTGKEVKLTFEKPIGGGATVGGFLSTGQVSGGGGPSRPVSGGGVSLSCNLSRYGF